MVNRHCFSLVGLPCSGKTTFGRMLSHAKGWDWTDLDIAVEEKVGCSIRDYIAREGTTAFRAMEASVLKELISQKSDKKLVLSTGGGIVLEAENRRILKENTTVVYLCRPLAAIIADITPEELSKRPLLQASSLQKLYDERHALYEEIADIFLEDPFGPSGIETFKNFH